LAAEDAGAEAAAEAALEAGAEAAEAFSSLRRRISVRIEKFDTRR